MATTNLNIRIDKAIKDQAEEILNELGLNMTTAVNMFLRTAIREHGIPFELKLEVPNDTTATAIEEGRKMMKDPSAPRHSGTDALKDNPTHSKNRLGKQNSNSESVYQKWQVLFL